MFAIEISMNSCNRLATCSPEQKARRRRRRRRRVRRRRRRHRRRRCQRRRQVTFCDGDAKRQHHPWSVERTL